ncbi:MAG: PsiF family protein [Polyangiaceae bacterium]
MIKSLLTALGFSLCLAGAAHAEDAKKAPTAQQQRMKDCNTQADGKKGDERKTFMSACLSGKPAPEAAKTVTPQQQRMKDCNAKAEGKKGDERKIFMSSCLKG